MQPLDPLAVPLVGVKLVEASAGTGKTYTITTLFVRLLLERGLAVSEILVVTFTQAAAAELRDRIRRRLRAALQTLTLPETASADPELARFLAARAEPEKDRAALQRALANFDEAAIFTIHGFCQRSLELHAFESGVRFDLRLMSDERPLIVEMVQDFWTREVGRASPAEVRYLTDRRLGIATLSTLARLVVGWPDLPVDTGDVAGRSSTGLLRYVALRDRAAHSWWGTPQGSEVLSLGVRARVRELLLENSALNGNVYRRASLPGMFDELDALLSVNEHTLACWFKNFTKFTQAALVEGTRKNQTPPTHPFFDLCTEIASAAADAREELEAWSLGLLRRFIAEIRSEMKRRKSVEGVQSFDDLLNQLLLALRADKAGRLAKRIASLHPAALIDEFQDTDPTQYEIFRTLYQEPGAALFLIGDPKQAIYAFRGADIFSYLDAAHDAGQDGFTLLTNYRSDPDLVTAINALFSRPRAPFLFDDIRFSSGTARPGAENQLLVAAKTLPALEFLFVPRNVDATSRTIPKRWAERHLPGLIAGHIREFLSSGATIAGAPLLPRDLAVLTRTNRQALELQQALTALNIPSVLHGDSNVLDSEEALEVSYLLRAMAEPMNARALRAALATSLFNVGAAELHALAENEQLWESWVDGFHQWHETWKRRGFVQAFRQMLRERGVAPRLLELPDGERKYTNLLHLVELLHKQASEQHLGITGLLQWFDDVRHDPTAREGLAPELQQIRLESDAHAVQLTTMHRAKGLEYPVVYCPYLWDGTVLFDGEKRFLRYHAPRAEGERTTAKAPLEPGSSSRTRHELRLDIQTEDKKEAALAQAEREAHAEKLRLLYVALTRAKHRTVVVWGAFYRGETSALGYLLHQPEGFIGSIAEATAVRLKTCDDEALLADLRELAAAANGTVGTSLLAATPVRPYVRLNPAVGVATARTWSRELDRSFRASSFSSLAASGTALSVPAREGHDRDDTDVVHDVRPAAVAAAPVTLHEFPRGAEAGLLLHSIFENLDFPEARADALASVITSCLERYGFAADLLPSLERAIGETLDTPLDDAVPGLCLRAIGKRQRLDELEFTVPVGRDSARGNFSERLTVRGLSGAFREYATSPRVKDYAENVARLGFPPLSGYLRGFIDLLFEYQGRWYVVDYKSNYLGATLPSYAAPELHAVMRSHHYYLQYHLYSLAVHRYLGTRLRDYAYDTHFGGVYYLFLRGLDPTAGPKYGVFADRPPLGLLDALGRALGAETPHAFDLANGHAQAVRTEGRS